MRDTGTLTSDTLHRYFVSGLLLGGPLRIDASDGSPIDAYYGEGTTEAEGSCTDMVVGRQNALHFAIGQGMRDLVKLLVERGADRNLLAWSATKTKGRTVSPIELARMCGHEDIVDLLTSQDTSVDMP